MANDLMNVKSGNPGLERPHLQRPAAPGAGRRAHDAAGDDQQVVPAAGGAAWPRRCSPGRSSWPRGNPAVGRRPDDRRAHWRLDPGADHQLQAPRPRPIWCCRTRRWKAWCSAASRPCSERRYPGIAIQAAALTFGVLAALLLAYKTRLIRVTQRFRAIVIGATLAIALFYLVSMVLSLFHVATPFLNDASPLSIGMSLVIVGIAALNLVLDFDLIETGVVAGRAALHGVVRRLRPAGHPGVAVHGNPAACSARSDSAEASVSA